MKRSRSNTPLQALTLLNDPVYVEAARALAERVPRDRPDATLDERLRYAFERCVSRSPDDIELAVLQELYHAQLAAAGGTSDKESVAWRAVAAALLNLDETITKN